jgi:hypothetical protein
VSLPDDGNGECCANPSFVQRITFVIGKKLHGYGLWKAYYSLAQLNSTRY